MTIRFQPNGSKEGDGYTFPAKSILKEILVRTEDLPRGVPTEPLKPYIEKGKYVSLVDIHVTPTEIQLFPARSAGKTESPVMIKKTRFGNGLPAEVLINNVRKAGVIWPVIDQGGKE